MPKVTKNTQNVLKEIIRWDSEKVGNGVHFHFITLGMSDDDPCLISKVDEQELIQYAIDYGMADDVEGAEQLLFDSFGDVRDSYWDNVEEIRLATAYKEACAYIDSYKATHSVMNEVQVKTMMIRAEILFSIQLPRVAA
jgi:hypothetical protein